MTEFVPHDMTLAGPADVIEGFLRSHRAAAYADLTQPAPWLAPVLAVIGPIDGTEAGQPVLRIGVQSSEPVPVPTGAWRSDANMSLKALGTWCMLPNTRVITPSQLRALFYSAERIALRAIPEVSDAMDRVLAQQSCNLDSPDFAVALQRGVDGGALTAARKTQVLAGVVV